jgi:hypothetical protein
MVDQLYRDRDEEDELPRRSDADAVFGLMQERNLVQLVSRSLTL